MEKRATPWQIAATYIGTVVGAGFASGQETLQFFAAFGGHGLFGILVASLGFSFLGAFLLRLGRRLNARTHRPLFIYACGRTLGWAIDLAVTAFLFGAMVVMLAGSGAIFTEHLGLPGPLGVALTMLLGLVTVLYGITGIMAANTLIIPLMLVLTCGITVYSLSHHGVSISDLASAAPEVAAAPHWLLSSLLYISYNLILAVPILGPLGREGHSRRIVTAGGVLGGLGLGLLSVMLAFVLMAHFPQVTNYQVPMLYIVRPYPKIIRYSFAFILWGEIFSTLIANLFGFSSRVSQGLGWEYRRIVVCSLLAAGGLSGIGFSTLVGTVYPLLGYIGLIFLLGLAARIARTAVHHF